MELVLVLVRIGEGVILDGVIGFGWIFEVGLLLILIGGGAKLREKEEGINGVAVVVVAGKGEVDIGAEMGVTTVLINILLFGDSISFDVFKRLERSNKWGGIPSLISLKI